MSPSNWGNGHFGTAKKADPLRAQGVPITQGRGDTNKLITALTQRMKS